MPDPDATERADLVARLRKEARDCRQFVYEFQDDEGRVSVRAQTLMKTANAFDIAADALETRRTPRELVCMICDRQYPIWYAPNELWNAVERQPDGSDEHPFLCPTCFANRANALGRGGVFQLSRAADPGNPERGEER